MSAHDRFWPVAAIAGCLLAVEASAYPDGKAPPCEKTARHRVKVGEYLAIPLEGKEGGLGPSFYIWTDDLPKDHPILRRDAAVEEVERDWNKKLADRAAQDRAAQLDKGRPAPNDPKGPPLGVRAGAVRVYKVVKAGQVKLVLTRTLPNGTRATAFCHEVEAK